ncbi:PREDICTED: zinc finger CCCH domain-containing 37 isoform [Prunus dulcis]|uniref:PREDICTED: zinc finger CCCH domain-containing 37 isoform n=1 Tax=Prunus dulcis TaxID=3755 RepID=A0A5E4GC19_PRUDU|nr:PREDICTED: zinc finger CCCH domain-containing 37 isoform [Prunus dulcis]
MSSHLFGYSVAQSAAATLSSVHTSRALTDLTLRCLSESYPSTFATDDHSRIFMSSYLFEYGTAQSAAAALSNVYTSRALTDLTLRCLSESYPSTSANDDHNRSSSISLRHRI